MEIIFFTGEIHTPINILCAVVRTFLAVTVEYQLPTQLVISVAIVSIFRVALLYMISDSIVFVVEFTVCH
ncbi:hypothetical protein F4678DRAFT_448093 [Xylaria arbuscula]|nr:hypothetical protein F4678DRAFT_448093 [Xylaria arbuscula]